MTTPPFDLAVTDALLSTTRSVRKRLDLDRPVEQDVILDCLRLAQQAPTGSNSQGWRWVVVTDPELRARLAELYREASADYFGAERPGADDQTLRVRDSAVYLRDNLQRVPVHVIPCINGRVDGSSNAEAAGFYGSILPAAWSFMLALRARGLGSAWTTLHLGREKEVAALLGIPDNVTQVALLPVAYTVGTDFKPAARPSVDRIVHVDGWS
ncbi:MAG: nitroreductase family protein [Acidimicrobiales bacterium]